MGLGRGAFYLRLGVDFGEWSPRGFGVAVARVLGPMGWVF